MVVPFSSRRPIKSDVERRWVVRRAASSSAFFAFFASLDSLCLSFFDCFPSGGNNSGPGSAPFTISYHQPNHGRLIPPQRATVVLDPEHLSRQSHTVQKQLSSHPIPLHTNSPSKHSTTHHQHDSSQHSSLPPSQSHVAYSSTRHPSNSTTVLTSYAKVYSC